jgi:heme exporter protein D
MKDGHKLGIAVILLLVIVVLAMSTLLKKPVTNTKKILQEETNSEIGEIQLEQIIDKNA